MSGSAQAFDQSTQIVPRDRRWNDDTATSRWYMGGDPVPSALFSALSATFPLGEKFFIDSVRRYRNRVGSKLTAEIDAFVIQEALHTREHLALNRLIEQTGYATAAMTERTRAVLAPFRKRSPLCQLGLTMALEHFTALLAHEVLTQDKWLAPAPESIRALWRWHAMEEIEHKAVAFDTFLAVTSHWSRGRRYAVRNAAMLEATWVLLSAVAGNMHDLFKQDSLPPRTIWRRTIAYLLGRGGLLLEMLPGYLAWFKPSFEPWHIDDRALAHAVAQELAQHDTSSESVLTDS